MRWVRRGATTLVGLVVLVLAILFGGSALLISRDVDAALPAIKATTDPTGIAEGGRLAAITGCVRCHGNQGQGQVLAGVPFIGHIVAPSLPRVAAEATDGQMARAIRNGVGIDARPLFIMPSHALNQLSSDDTARLIGWIRTLPTSAFDVMGSTAVGVQGRFAILTGRLPDSVEPSQGQSKARPADIGRYFAQLSCGQCHALDRDETTGAGRAMAPALVRAAQAYDVARFRALLRTGKGRGGHALPVMTEASQSGMAQLSDLEIDAIHAYLVARGSKRAEK
jgi:mono/diheme cytochrome c family protein